MIRIENVNKYYNYHKKNQVHVIDNTTLELPDSGLVAILGPSGCGKTTLLNVIGGLDKIQKGKIFVNNRRITKKRPYYIDKTRHLNIGYIFQNYNLIDDKTVFDNVAISLKMFGVKDKKEISDKVNYVLETLGIYRYRNRLAGMLSGGERQRVGIARAIVKDPSIILADEPTGNLDSSNTIETMNIIKSISKSRLVILVTHEKELAKFYADRIIELEDGKIVNDYEHKNNSNLDYRIDNKIYLKDFKYNYEFKDDDNHIKIYNNTKNDINLTIVVKNNNIYIKGNKNSKIEVIDNDSNVELINDNYKQIDKSVYEKYEFNSEKLNNNYHKYSSIFRFSSLFKSAFNKILNYSFIKKLLLLGFLASASFVTYSVCNIMGLTNIKDSYFVTAQKDYYHVKLKKIDVNRYNKLENLKSVDYLLPGNSEINFKMDLSLFYQSNDASMMIGGSIASLDKVKKADLIYGRMPLLDNEIVVDKQVFDSLIESTAAFLGFQNPDDYLDYDLLLKDGSKYKIVGVSDNEEPVIYANKSKLIEMSYYSYSSSNFYDDSEDDGDLLIDYHRVNNLVIKEGRLPENDYEVVVNIDNKYDMPINKKINNKVNNNKLVVVGYYESENNNLLVNSQMIKEDLITNKEDIIVMPLDKENIVSDFNSESLDIVNVYDKELKSYKQEKKASVFNGSIASIVFIVISFIEIYLIVRSSFLTRIKEVGIYRAIGVKKLDIYKLFFGEIFIITTVISLPGVLLVGYCLSVLQSITYFAQNYLVNIGSLSISIILIYVFNILIGLLPVARVLRSTPSAILSRKDID